MNNSKPRKQVPKVAEEIDRNLADISGQVQSNVTQAGASKARPRPFRELVDYSKLQFGQKLIGWCIFLIVALSLISHFSNGVASVGNKLDAAIELLKLVMTTALGFVFARTQIAAQQRERDDDN